MWERAWEMERDEWNKTVPNDKHYDLIGRVMKEPSYLEWWNTEDSNQSEMKQCESMVKRISHTSLLKGD